MVPLARKTLLHEWRRFLPSAVAVAFSGLLLLVQSALVLGIFGSAAVPEESFGQPPRQFGIFFDQLPESLGIPGPGPFN